MKAVPLVAITFFTPDKIDRDAVHLPFDQHREAGFADCLACLVEIEEDISLGIERCFRRVQVLRSSLVACFKGSRGEGDHAARFVRNREGHALAETRVERSGLAVFLLLEGEEA